MEELTGQQVAMLSRKATSTYFPEGQGERGRVQSIAYSPSGDAKRFRERKNVHYALVVKFLGTWECVDCRTKDQ